MGVTPEPEGGAQGAGPGVPNLETGLARRRRKAHEWGGSGALTFRIQVMNQLVHDASN